MFYIMNQREMRNQKSLEKARNLDVRLEEALYVYIYIYINYIYIYIY